MRITINDLAKATGYSKTTVSFVFNDPTRVSDAARGAVLAKAQELGYIPDPLARSLSSRRLGTIGLLLPQSIPLALLNPHMVQLITGIGQVCNAEGLSLTVLPPLKGDMISSAKAAAVDGLVTVGLTAENDLVKVIRQRHVPCVTIDGEPGEGMPCVSIDNRRAGEAAMRYVLGLGHRRIAIVALSDATEEEGIYTSFVGRARLTGYREALASENISLDSPGISLIAAECSLSGGRAAGQRIAEMPTAPEAVISMSDVMAIGAMTAFRDTGISVPSDMSVMGFDDIREAAIVSPGLTTLHQPAEEKGHRAARLLVRLMNNDPVERRVEFGHELIERESCASA
jgi:DNA-binding LacI/PurR family transcriptional regulator